VFGAEVFPFTLPKPQAQDDMGALHDARRQSGALERLPPGQAILVILALSALCWAVLIWIGMTLF
jgi:hypothetical protein